MRRTRADWPIVAAALLTMLLATTLLAAGPIYSSAVSVAGLRQTLAEAPVEAGNIRVTAGVPLAQIDAVDQAVAAELARVAGTLPAEIARLGTGESFALPGQGDDVRDLAVPGFAEGAERHSTLVAGAWPVAATEGSPVQVAISDAVAEQLGLAVGDQFEIVSRLDDELIVPITIAGVFRIDDAGDPFWWADARTLEGLTESDQYRTYGPFLMTRADMLNATTAANVSLSWRLMPSFAEMNVDDLTGLRSRVAALPQRLERVAQGYSPTVVTELGQTLAQAQRSLLVSRTGMLLVMAQLALLGGYAILLTAGLLIDHRRVETSLLRSRGAGPGHVAGLAAVEGLILAVPAVLLGPWLAMLALGLFDRIGPLAAVGLSVPLQVTSDAYLAAGIAGAACVALLTVPALFSARGVSSEQRSLSREETRPLAQRLGIDIALVVLGIIALWQLRLYGTPLTRTMQGSLGPDPLLIAAPALGLLLGAVVATRVLPRLAEGAQEVLSRGRSLVGAMGSYQLARRPLRYTRSALMLMLAMSIGVFAVSYAATWTDSQRSQADHQSGADVRVIPSVSARALPSWKLASSYTAVPGVEDATPIERYPLQLTRNAEVNILAVDSEKLPELLRVSADPATAPPPDLLSSLVAARPQLAGNVPVIPAGTESIVVHLALDVRGLDRLVDDPTSGNLIQQEEDPAVFDTQASIRMSMAVRDARGVVHRIAVPPRTPADIGDGIEIPLPSADGPLEILSLDPSLGLRQDLVVTDGSVTIDGITLGGAEVPAAVPLELGGSDTWQMTWLDPERGPLTLQPSAAEGLGMTIGGGPGSGSPSELTTGGPFNPVTYSLQPDAVAVLPDVEIPVLMNQPALEATSLEPGQSFRSRLAGAERQLKIAGVIDSFPTTVAASPLVIVDLQTLALLRMQAGHSTRADAGNESDTRRPDEWWLDLSGGTQIDAQQAGVAEDVERALAARPFTSISVATAAGRLRTLLSDPVAIGIIGALGIGAVAAGLFALIGLAVAAAVSARQRQTEFALMRALGLSRRQLSTWL
ncbi:MAG TPA: FtsX-like permease family protein, partial [Candidatus Limnocylindrales bacterium]|nr:FtsX-like permease family protein [Candidatus Limnocylindrales bacterium]